MVNRRPSSGSASAPPVRVVWFKRDLRAVDHRPLVEAARCGPVLPLFVVEPELPNKPDASGRQWAFARECLVELRETLTVLGQPLIVRTGDVVEVLEGLRGTVGVAGLHSHQETGNAWTFARDRRVGAWCRAQGIPWHESRQNGVIRALADRRGWAARWDRLMRRPPVDAPSGLEPLDLEAGELPDAAGADQSPDPCPGRQRGGRARGLEMLRTFLETRGEPYQRAMSSPNTAFEACSRLSAHIAYGTLSLGEIVAAVEVRRRALNELPPKARGRWPGALRSFLARLHWHCHFMQKLEDEPRIEFESFHPAYDGLRDDDPASPRLDAWCRGETGVPYIDACMRALALTGYLPFRARAMLMSFAAYHLWLHWRLPGLHLARSFTDYEPGIHWSQCQMQSATTGINLARIYNPIKQGQDHDPDGRFIRRFLPELDPVPDVYLQEPWKWPKAEAELRGRYPRPIVDERLARQQARERIWQVRRTPGYHEISDRIQAKHGSRKSGITQQERLIRAARRAGRATTGDDQERLL